MTCQGVKNTETDCTRGCIGVLVHYRHTNGAWFTRILLVLLDSDFVIAVGIGWRLKIYMVLFIGVKVSWSVRRVASVV